MTKSAEVSVLRFLSCVFDLLVTHFHFYSGTADRLKPVPYAIRVAYQSKRILLIRWERPAKLEEFIVPPKGGFDWRVPDFLAEKVSFDAMRYYPPLLYC
jgi:hypothetical protein